MSYIKPPTKEEKASDLLSYWRELPALMRDSKLLTRRIQRYLD